MIYTRWIGSPDSMWDVEKNINAYLLDGKNNKFDIIDQEMANLNKDNIYKTWELINQAIDFASKNIKYDYPNKGSEHLHSIFNQALKRKSIFLEKVKSLIY